MANITDTYGVIHINGEYTREHLETIAIVLWTQHNSSDYSMYFNDCSTYQELLKLVSEQEPITFDAGGRWEFLTNLKQLGMWSYLDATEWNEFTKVNHINMPHKVYEERRVSLNKHLNLDNQTYIQFDYTDMDPGQDFIDEVRVVLSSHDFHSPDNIIEQPFSVDVEYVQQYDCSFDNWLHVFMRDEMYKDVLGEFVVTLLSYYNLFKGYDEPKYQDVVDLLTLRSEEWTLSMDLYSYMEGDISMLQDDAPQLVEELDKLLGDRP